MAAEDADSGFLGRWSRRKALVRAGQLPPEPVLPPAVKPAGAAAPSALPGGPQAVAVGGAAEPAQTPPPASAERPPASPPPTLDDVAKLTPDADFSPFVARQTDPAVRNAAMKKLFADPHFNVMDGLDIYIDDYSKPDPLPLEMARQMVSAQFMKLFDEPGPSSQGAASAEAVPAPAPLAAHTAPAVVVDPNAPAEGPPPAVSPGTAPTSSVPRPAVPPPESTP